MLDLYIYYQVRDADAAALQALVVALQARLQQQYGVMAQLKRRPELSDGLQTWMEIYPAASAAVLQALDLATQEPAFTALTAGLRHREFFEDLIPCA